eukprot:TRINITY_DN7438_c0_g1_i1.p1 TRINITY_DN7438_c0_g1~~TRINITY_DN7438_c0_g1_i1.p1  ORF type:complete len:744 (-),score=157.19 TRINITY_DN7438_c0_g1_i1:3-2069(-)
MLADSDEEDSETEPSPDTVAHPVSAGYSQVSAPAPAPKSRAAEAKPAAGKTKKKKKGKGKKSSQVADAKEEMESDDDALLDRLAAESIPDATTAANTDGDAHPLSMSRNDFRPERERKRIFGSDPAGGRSTSDRKGFAARARGGHEGRQAHYRRLFLVEPTAEESWPRPDAHAKMTATTEAGEPMFSIETTTAHSRVRSEFASIQALHDPNEVQHFVLERPFCVEALLVFFEICRGAGEHEQAFQILRRAAYAVDCGFSDGFSPFSSSSQWPRVRIVLPETEEHSWPGWPWLATLWAYMLSLATQGLSRSALEVSKLLLATTLPRDPLHVLVHCDLLCLKAGEYDLLIRLAREFRTPEPPSEEGTLLCLDTVLPNFAYSAALGLRFKAVGGRGSEVQVDDAEALRTVCVADVLPVPEASAAETEASPSHAALMRAMLIFPQVLRPLLEALSVNLSAPAPKGSPYRSSWSDLLEQKPFVRFNDFQHSRHFLPHALIAAAYAQQHALLWRGEPVLRWLHACAGRLVQMSESSVFDTEITNARQLWRRSPLCLEQALVIDYKDFSSSELSTDRKYPGIVERALNSLVAEPAAVPATGLGGVDEEEELQRALRMSLAAADSRERQRLIEEQDAELQQSLAIDRAREQGGEMDREVDSLQSQLVEMGFEAADAREALLASAGDLEVAIGQLTK